MSTPTLTRPARTYWKVERLKLSYSGIEERREQVRLQSEANLIASLCANGLHAPALDLDFEVDTVNVGDRTLLTFHKRVPMRGFKSLLRAWQASGMWPGGEWWWQPGSVTLMTLYPTRLVASSTPGHHHLYYDREITWEEYAELLRGLRDAGLIQRGFCRMSLRRKMTMLRLPGHTKKTTPLQPRFSD